MGVSTSESGTETDSGISVCPGDLSVGARLSLVGEQGQPTVTIDAVAFIPPENEL